MEVICFCKAKLFPRARGVCRENDTVTVPGLTPCPANTPALFSRVYRVVGLPHGYELRLEVRIAPVCVFSNKIAGVL